MNDVHYLLWESFSEKFSGWKNFLLKIPEEWTGIFLFREQKYQEMKKWRNEEYSLRTPFLLLEIENPPRRFIWQAREFFPKIWYNAGAQRQKQAGTVIPGQLSQDSCPRTVAIEERKRAQRLSAPWKWLGWSKMTSACKFPPVRKTDDFLRKYGGFRQRCCEESQRILSVSPCCP